MVVRNFRSRCIKNALTLLCALWLVLAAPLARASAAAEVVLDSMALNQLESRADSAQLKEQCFLYTEILHHLTELAGKQIADGEEEQAKSTLRHIDSVTSKVQQALARDAKRLKSAEMLLEHTTRRLSDMLHITSGDQRDVLQATLLKVDAVHTNLLGQVFSK